ncbi:MAG: sigma-54-dependent Fis family transcriptional regulator [Nitrospinae bacterium]|nr:sigma-54-dependent Fis family transcriptional regulator [Nitrospinota bacterium]
MERRGDILVVDDDTHMRDLVAKVLTREGYAVRALPRAQEVLQALDEAPTDLVISDIKMPEMDGLTLLNEVTRVSPETSVILMTAFGSIDSAVQAMKAGAYDYLTKPFKLDEITLVVRRAMEERHLRAEVQALRAEVTTRYHFANIIGKSKPMQDLFALITKVASSRSTVLVLGKSGTGKELVAKAIHYNSPRRQRPLVTVNCSAIPKELLESELFGHVKGAFTGAIANKRGLFEEADGGSLFLDEIGDLSPELQIKLLRVIQEREIKRVGDTRTITIDVRLIAATNRDLAQAVREGTFREDLYYRLNVIPIDLPELKERPEDIPLLATHFLLKYAKEATSPIEGISKEAMRLLLEYDWPGNVRELENVIERAVILGRRAQILPEDLPQQLRTHQPAMRRRADTRQPTLEELEQDYIATVLRETGWHRMKAAQILGIDRRTLYRKIRIYGLQPTA